MADDSRKQIRGRMKKCPVCGREFWCYDPVLWAYRERNRRGEAKGHICSWSCQVKHNAELETKRNAKLEAQHAKYKARLEAKRLERLEARRDAEPETVTKYWLGNLAGTMEEKSVTAYGMAKALPISHTALYNYKKTKMPCDMERAKLIAGYLGVTVETLVTKKEDTV